MQRTQVTLVTGAAGALGAAVVTHLASAGHKVAAADRSAERLKAFAAPVLPLAFDLGDEAAWGAVLGRITTELGPLTGAVLVAGAWQGGAPLHARTDDTVWRAMLGANLETVYRGLRAALPSMVENKHGSIVVVGSRAALRPETSAGAAEYAATKSAVVALAETVAAEVVDAGVRVNAILPSTMDTPANRKAMPKADASKWVSLSSVAGVIAFLLGDDARDVSGAALPIYGRAT